MISIRKSQDDGFNVDFEFPALRDLFTVYSDIGIETLFKDSSQKINFKNLNSYINKSIKNTRSFHVDSKTKQLKAFIYLTDCLLLDDGPHTYVKGSHLDGPLRRLNQSISQVMPNRTKNPENIMAILAKKGSIIASDQGGSHRGFPQAKDGQRVIAVLNIGTS